MNYLLKEQLVFCFHFFLCCSFLLLDAEISDSGVDEDVVPLDEFAYVARIDAVFVPVGQHLCEPRTEGGIVRLLRIEGCGLESLFLPDPGQHFAEGDVVACGEHRDIGKGYNLIARVSRHAFAV